MTNPLASIDADADGIGHDQPVGASRKVYLGILQDLEEGRMVPGQRLVEVDLSARFGVGRNAVREAMQRLAVRGVVDLSRNRSGAIRQIDLAETMEILYVAAAMTALAAETAARHFDSARHGTMLDAAMAALTGPKVKDQVPGAFSRARRGFYRALLAIGGNRELQRLFPAIGMQIIYSQFQSPRLQRLRLSDYEAIHSAVIAGDPAAARRASIRHVENVRAIISEEAALRQAS